MFVIQDAKWSNEREHRQCASMYQTKHLSFGSKSVHANCAKTIMIFFCVDFFLAGARAPIALLLSHLPSEWWEMGDSSPSPVRLSVALLCKHMEWRVKTRHIEQHVFTFMTLKSVFHVFSFYRCDRRCPRCICRHSSSLPSILYETRSKNVGSSVASRSPYRSKTNKNENKCIIYSFAFELALPETIKILRIWIQPSHPWHAFNSFIPWYTS